MFCQSYFLSCYTLKLGIKPLKVKKVKLSIYDVFVIKYDI